MPEAAADRIAYPTLEMGLSAAQAARARGEVDVALGIYAALRAAFPHNAEGWRHAASACLDSARYDDSDALLDEALRLFPDNAAVAIDSAWVAHRRRDTSEAWRRWERVRDRFPDHPIGYTGAVVTLRDAGLLDAANTLLAHAADKFPNDSSPVIELAWMAVAKRDWAEALQRWDTVRARFPRHFLGYTGAAMALRETGRFDPAEALLVEAQQKFPDNPQASIERARLAAAQRGAEAAVELWDEVRRRFPHQVEAYIGGAAVLRELRRYDAAGEVLAEALPRFPGNPSILIEFAWLAHFTRDWNGAVQRWQEVRRLFPGHATGFLSGAIALREAGRPDAADALLREAEARFPEATEFGVERARLAQSRQKWADAALHWDTVRARIPDDPAGYLGGAVCLREQQRYEEADAVLVDAMARFPAQPGPLLERAWLNHRRGMFREALPLWEQIRRDHPEQVMGFTGGAVAFRESGKGPEAETLLVSAQARFPNDAGPVLEYGWLAHMLGDIAESKHRFALATERFPNEPNGFLGLARCLADLGEFDAAEDVLQSSARQFPAFQSFAQELSGLPDRRRDWDARLQDAPIAEGPRLPSMPRPDPARIDPKLREFVMRFASLGGAAPGWEFGMVQRACGAEPNDLLRWADMSFEKLLMALEQRFAELGMPDATELFAMPDERGALEYCIRDRRGMMETRCFVAQASVPADEMFAAICRRLQFQTTKLIEDLKKGDRIFVWRAFQRSPGREEMKRLHAAVRSFGNATLLLVLPANEAHSNGAVEAAAPGLLIGYIDQFANRATGDMDAVPVEAWLSVLGNADAIHRTTPAVHLDAPAEPADLPRPAVSVAPAQIKLMLCGFHHAHRVGTIVSRLPPLRGRIQLERLDPGQDADAVMGRLPPGRLAAADVYFEESMVGNRETKRALRAALSGRCEFLSFQTPHMTALWPFMGRDDRLTPEPPVYNGGRYANTDRIAASLAGLEMTDDALFDAYMELTAAAPIDMNALLAADVKRWQAEDGVHDVKLSAFLHGEFRDRRLFTTPHERAAAVLRETVLQLLETPTLGSLCAPETLRAALDRLTHGWLGSRQELPVHPLVAEHFGLRWWAPDLRYRMLGNRFTFRDYIVRYIRWSPWLA